jgi:hypothetical protein
MENETGPGEYGWPKYKGSTWTYIEHGPIWVSLVFASLAFLIAGSMQMSARTVPETAAGLTPLEQVIHCKKVSDGKAR